LETLFCRVELNIIRKDGSLVKYKKIQYHKPLTINSKTYTEAFSADGTIRNFKVSPGKIIEIKKEAGTIYITTEFGNTIDTKKKIERTFECLWVDSFTQCSEYWEERQHYPTRLLEVCISFPKSRPPISWSLELREGARLKAHNFKIRLITYNGKPSLYLKVKNTKLNEDFILKWNW
jgi:hypothetical protein